jgi:hypothetical protein
VISGWLDDYLPFVVLTGIVLAAVLGLVIVAPVTPSEITLEKGHKMVGFSYAHRQVVVVTRKRQPGESAEEYRVQRGDESRSFVTIKER